MSLPPSPLPSRPLRRDARRNRQRILEAGRGLVVEHGLNVSHEQIAEAADVAVGTVYRHFPDRELLVEELLTGHVEAVVARAQAAAQIEDPWESLVSFMVRRRRTAGLGVEQSAFAGFRSPPEVITIVIRWRCGTDCPTAMSRGCRPSAAWKSTTSRSTGTAS